MTSARSNDALLITLQLAVPMHIDEVRHWSFSQRDRHAKEAAEAIACHGDTLQYGGKRGEAAQVFNQLARGLAVLACQPGGVTFAGQHWCAWPHPHCPSRSRPRPPCCVCGAECSDRCSCPWCANGCAGASGATCCLQGRPERPATAGRQPLVPLPGAGSDRRR